MIIDFFKYIWRGSLHYLNILFRLFDFKDLGFMWIILIGLLFISIFNKNVRQGVLSLAFQLINVVKTIPGFIFFCLFFSYYIYVLFFFEEKITIVVLIFSIYMLIKDYVKTNLNLSLKSENTIWNSIKSISIPVIMLCFQQIAMMIENNSVDNIKYVLLSLIIIPIFSVLFFIMKFFNIYNDFYLRYKKYINVDDYAFFKIFTDCLIECKTYKKNEVILSKFIIDNKNATIQQLKQKFNHEIKNNIEEENINNKNLKRTKVKIVHSKIFKIFNYIWIFNMLNVILYIIIKRFTNLSFDFWYYCSFTILIINFWYDLMKTKKIENQFYCIIYMFIYAIFIIFLLTYYYSLNGTRLTELGFLIPIFFVLKIYTYNKKFPNLFTLPFL